MGNRWKVDVNQGTITNYSSNSLNQYTAVGGNSYSYDDNGNLINDGTYKYYYDCENRLTDVNDQMELVDQTSGDDTTLTYNFDNKLRSAAKGGTTIDVKYDPLGNRIWKDSSEAGERKYIVDIVGSLPVILLELNTSVPSVPSVAKTYIWANGQILAQHDGSHYADRYFYLHDRLGSVREVINDYGNVVNCYTYNPFGEIFATESTEGTENPFKFTGQFYDSEIDQYYLRARMYDPHLYRFTARDPIFGQFEDPLSLHKYLYCGNDPVNRFDPSGLSWEDFVMWLLAWLKLERPGYIDADTEMTLQIMEEATKLVGEGYFTGTIKAFGIPGYYDYKGSRSTFRLYNAFMYDSEFGNFLAGYTTYYNYAGWGDIGVRTAGHGDAFSAKLEDLIYNRNRRKLSWLDDLGSKYFISAGILQAREDRWIDDLKRGNTLSFVLAKTDLFYGYERITTQELNSEGFWQELLMWTQFWNSASE